MLPRVLKRIVGLLARSDVRQTQQGRTGRLAAPPTKSAHGSRGRFIPLRAAMLLGALALSNAHAQFVPLSGVTQVSVGSSYTCALTTAGGVKCWGNNSSGQLGDNSIAQRLTPVDVTGLSSGVSAIAAGSNHACALTTAGGVKCWGDNSNGQLGDNSTAQRLTPVDVTGLSSGVMAIASGGTHTCALTAAGGIKCWGNNSVGQLGDNSTTQRLAPVDVTGLSSGLSALVAGGGHNCALTTAGEVKCWGHNANGQLGDGLLTDRWLPVTLTVLGRGILAIAAGNFQTCALTGVSGVKCWGNNSFGQLGDNSTLTRLTPVDVAGLTGATSGIGVSLIAAGSVHNCALTMAGGVKCWGDNLLGQIGDNSTTQRLTPVDVVGLTGSGVTGIASGQNATHSCAFISGGGIKCWGSNSNGQLGDNSTTQRLTPVVVLIANAAPSATAVTLKGTAQVGQVLTGIYIYSDTENDPEDTGSTGTSYSFLSGGTIIKSGATSGAVVQNYSVQANDLNTTLEYCVTPKAISGSLQGSAQCSALTAPSYSKIANDGSVLPDTAVLGSGAGDWACTRDNTTGLTWEVKTADGGLRDWNKNYTNYDDPTQAQKFVVDFFVNPTQAEIDAASNSIGLVNAVNTNASALCGYRDWKMPGNDELLAIVDTAYVPVISPTYFPNTSSSSFWSGSPSASYSYYAWFVYFFNGYVYYYDRDSGSSVRLVRGGQSLGPFGLTLSATGTGSGILADSSGSLNCSSAAGTSTGICSASLASGASVTLTATPASGSTFTGWSGACSGTSSTCTVIMAARKSVTANFGSLISQTITFGAPPVALTVGASATVSATGGASGQPVTFSSLTLSTCSVTGSAVTGVGTGTCTVAADQAGDATYSAAAQATQSFAIASHSYSKIANDGSVLPDTAVLGSGAGDWACTRDNTTGLTWEVKTADGGLRDWNKTYTNYDDPTQAQKFVVDFFVNPTQAEIDAASNSIGLVNAVNTNASALCGYVDWKMPSRDELQAIVDTSYSPTISPTYFPNTASSVFWSGSPIAGNSSYAWGVYFGSSYVNYNHRSNAFGVRLVRGGQSFDTFGLSISATGTGSGTLTGSAGNINCTSTAGNTSGTCSASLASGVSVTLTATPATGSTFSSWSGACSGTSATCTVIMAARKSATANFGPLISQTITFGAPPVALTVGASATVSATGGASGLPVTFSSQTPSTCSVTGSAVTGVGTGTCTVAADQAGDATYSAAAQATQSFAIASHSYSKIANDGSVLPDTAVLGSGAGDWACTRDNTTGLTWEVKTADGGLRDWNKTYTNYDDPTQLQIGGFSPVIDRKPTQAEIDAASNSIGLINAVNTNASALCGFRDWKMPSISELSAIVDNAYSPMINPTFFPNTPSSNPSMLFWSGSPLTMDSTWALGVNFLNGGIWDDPRDFGWYVSLVRGGQSSGTFPLSLSATGSGSGTLTGSAGNINCTSTAGNTSGTCSASLASGVSVTLTATPATGSTFSSWSGACSGTSATCTVIMAAAKSVTASFNSLTPQTITFGTLPTVVVGGTGILSASASSGLTVTFSSLTTSTCSVSGSSVTGIAAGTCTVAANQAGNSTYDPAPQVTQSFTVGKASQTISFGAAPALLIGVPGTLSATATSGLTVTFSSLTTSACSVSGSSVTGIAAGTCTVAANQAGNSTYDPAPQVTQSFTVGKASQTISFGAAPALLVGGTGILSASASSGLTVTFSSLTTSACSVSGSSVTGIAAGACTVAANQAGDATYEPAPQVAQSITISSKASQTIRFGAAPSLLVGGSASISATATSGLEVSLSSGTPSICTVSGNTVAGLAAGSCTVAADQAGNSNTNAAPQATQSFTVGKGNQTLSFGAVPSLVAGGSASVSASATSGLAVTFTAAPASVCTLSGSTVSAVSGGTCSVVAHQAGDSNYNAAPQVSQSFMIGKLSQTISFGAAPTLMLGDTASLSATATSGLGVTFSSSTPNVCSVAGSSVTGFAAGTCTVAAHQGGSGRYEAAPPVAQSFTVGLKNSQKITFGAAPSVVVGGTGSLSATSSSGLPVTFSSQTMAVCTVSDSTVTGVALGTCTVAASQAGDASTSQASRVTQSFAISAVPAYTLSVDASGASGVAIGASPSLYAGTTLYRQTGIAEGTALTLTAPSSAGGAAFSAWSGCDSASGVRCSLTLNASKYVTARYAAVLLNQSITFGPAPTLAAGGTATVRATASSGLPVTFSSSTAAVCTVAGSTVTGLAAGTCTVVAQQAGDSNTGPAPQVTQSFNVAAAAARHYQKIAHSGATLPDSAALGNGASDWACTRDPGSSLLWEVKTADGGLRDLNRLYTNFDDPAQLQKWNGSALDYPSTAEIDAASNSLGLVKAVKASALCGSVEWRMPSRDELRGLWDLTATPRIDPDFFPHTSGLYYWSGTPSAYTAYDALNVYFSEGGGESNHRYNTESVRLVSGVDMSQPVALSVSTSGTGSGNIASSTGGIACARQAGIASGTCLASLLKNSTVVLTATPAPGSYFAGWSGDCTGTGSCSVTLNAAKRITASFRALPFVATASNVITPSSVTISTRLTFNTADLGKPGSVFITAWMPVSGLSALGLSPAKSSGLRVSSTLENPALADARQSLQVTQALLAATDSNAFALVQLTASGWQLVVNGQLIPYASGVLGDLLAAQTLLKNANPSSLVGSQFCLGYGSSAEEMIAAGRMLPVASITDLNTVSSASTGSCNIAASVPDSSLSGLWWNENESGWGLSLTQRNAMAVAAWYTYDAVGQPAWMIMSSCPVVGSGCSGDLYHVTGGTPFAAPWEGSAKVVGKVGVGTLAFTDNNTGTLNFSVNGVSGAKQISRVTYATGSSTPAIDYSAVWWNEEESGWGVTLTQQYGIIFAVIYTYDASGSPVWYVASSCPLSGTSCTGDLYQVTGGSAPAAPWNGANKAVRKVGALTFDFNDSSIATMRYTINGTAGSKAISRLLF